MKFEDCAGERWLGDAGGTGSVAGALDRETVSAVLKDMVLVDNVNSWGYESLR